MSTDSSPPQGQAASPADEEAFITSGDTLEEIDIEDGDHPMGEDEDDGDDEVEMLNDSSRFFDGHKDSIFSIARNPKHPEIIATGGGDDVAYIWSSTSSEQSSEGDNSNSSSSKEAKSQPVLFKLEGHKDSITALEFTASGELLIAGGLDGKVSIVRNANGDGKTWKLLATANEVEEVNWVIAHPVDGTCFAVGANDGSVWIYTVDTENAKGEHLVIRHVFYKHQGSCTAGSWAQNGALLVTVSEDGSMFVHDAESGEVKLNFGPEDKRFEIEGGLYSVAVNANGSIAVVGGATGECKVIALPAAAGAGGSSTGAPAAGGKKGAGGKKAGSGAASGSGTGAAHGGIIATLAAQKESVETLAFAPTQPLLAAGSVDGTIVLYDAARWAVRRTIKAHSSGEVEGGAEQKEGEEEEAASAVVKLEFSNTRSVRAESEWELYSCSTDGTLRKWDCRTGEAKAVWKGHADESEGIMGFVQSKDGAIVTAGDDGVALIFQTE